jgi:thymidylate synthase (FAD)
MGGASLSAAALDTVKRILAGEAVTQESSGLGKREWREFLEMLGREEP